jgi:hypothetical protein
VLAIVGALAIGILGTSVVYETTVVAQLRHQATTNAQDVIDLSEQLDTDSKTIRDCQTAESMLLLEVQAYADARDAEHASIDSFFNSYDPLAGDVVSLYLSLHIHDGDIEAAGAGATSVSPADCLSQVVP